MFMMGGCSQMLSSDAPVNSRETASAQKTASAQSISPLTVSPVEQSIGRFSVDDVHQAVRDNKINVKTNYDKRILQIYGYAGEFGAEDGTYLYLDGTKDRVGCSFPSSQRPILSQLKKESRVIIQGRFDVDTDTQRLWLHESAFVGYW